MEYIRYNQLRKISDEVVRTINKGGSGLGGGSFKSIIKRCEAEKYFRIEERKKETRIYPDTSLIKQVVEIKEIQNLDYGNKIIRIGDKNDPFPRARSIFEPSIQISELLARQTSKARAPPIESIKVSDGVSVVVTRANPSKEVYK